MSTSPTLAEQISLANAGSALAAGDKVGVYDVSDTNAYSYTLTQIATLLSTLGLGTLVNQLRTKILYNVFGNPGFARNSNFDVANATAFYYTNNGTLKTMAATQNWDTGTTKTITTAKWASALLSVTSAAANVVTWSASDYASEALAIAALPALPTATNTVVGYITVLAAGSTWTAGTDALASGTGGTPATTTNYYNDINPNAAFIGAAAS